MIFEPGKSNNPMPNIQSDFYSPFCVSAKVTKLVGLKNKGGLSPINLVTFAITQNGEFLKNKLKIRSPF